jgi:hypothetical protein
VIIYFSLKRSKNKKMAFGDSTKQAATKQQTQNTDPVFIDLKSGSIRIIRILGDEVQFKEAWLEVPVKVGEDIKTLKRPFIVAVFNPTTGYFEHPDHDRWYDNPISVMVNEMEEAEAKKNAPKTRFAVNVLNRTPAKKNEDGTFVYSDDGDPLETVQVLVQSAGKEGGKHFLQALLTSVEGLRNPKTRKPVGILETDLKVITKGTGIETVRAVVPDFNQEPLDKEYVLYDLVSFYTPWPSGALQEIVDGAEYSDVRNRYKIPAFPTKVGTPLTEEDLPF